MVSIPFLKLDRDDERGFAKQVSTYASTNSTKHKDFFALIGWTKLNMHLWLPVLLAKRFTRTIHTYSLYRTKNTLRVTYELEVPLVDFLSEDYITGHAGSNANITDRTHLSYCLVIEYKKDVNNNCYIPRGKIITGFLRDTPYKIYQVDWLNYVCPFSLAWGGALPEITNPSLDAYQDTMIRTPLQLPVSQRTSLIQLNNPTRKQAKLIAELQADPTKKVTPAHMKLIELNLAYPAEHKVQFFKIVKFVVIRNYLNIKKMFSGQSIF